MQISCKLSLLFSISTRVLSEQLHWYLTNSVHQTRRDSDAISLFFAVSVNKCDLLVSLGILHCRLLALLSAAHARAHFIHRLRMFFVHNNVVITVKAHCILLSDDVSCTKNNKNTLCPDSFLRQVPVLCSQYFLQALNWCHVDVHIYAVLVLNI